MVVCMCMCWSGVCVCLQEFISVCTGWFMCQWSCVCLIHPLFANLIFHPEELSYYLYYRGEMGYFLTSGKYNLLMFLIYLLFCFLIKKKEKKKTISQKIIWYILMSHVMFKYLTSIILCMNLSVIFLLNKYTILANYKSYINRIGSL